MVVAYMSVYCVHQLHFTIQQAGVIMMLFGVGSIFGGYIGGRLTDKIGFYDIQLGALISGGMLFMALGYLHTFLSLGIGAVVLSIFNESVRPANASAIAHYSSPENKTRSVSLNRLAINLGWAMGGGMGGLLAAVNYHLLFWVDGGTNVMAAVLLLLLMPKAKVAPPKAIPEPGAVRISAYKDKTYLLFILLGLFFFICFYEFMIIEPAFYKIEWHFNERFIGFLLALNGLIIALIEMVIIHNLERKRPGLFYIIIGVALAIAGFILMNILPGTALTAIVVVIIITFSEMLCMPFMNSFWISRSSAHNRGQYAALYSMAWSAAQIIAPLIGGLVVGYGGFTMLWWLLAAMSLVSAIGYVFLYKNNHREQSSLVLP